MIAITLLMQHSKGALIKLRCPKCKVNNSDKANFCISCGTSLKLQQFHRQSRKLYTILFCLIILIFLGIVVLKLAIRNEKSSISSSDSDTSLPYQTSYDGTTLDLRQILIKGKFTVKDNQTKTTNHLITTLMSGNWIAAPTVICTGGEDWYYSAPKIKTSKIIKGICRPGDPVGLWQVNTDIETPLPELKSWNNRLQLYWYSYDSTKPYPEQIIIDSDITEAGFFKYFPLSKQFLKPGVLLQKNRLGQSENNNNDLSLIKPSNYYNIVGWTFGKIFKFAYLWCGPDGNNLDFETTVSSYYQSNFENSREALYNRGMSVANNNPLLKLDLLTKGICQPQTLALEDTPIQLRRPNIIKTIINLSNELSEQGYKEELADILTPEVIIKTDNIRLFEIAIYSISSCYSYADTIQFIDKVNNNFKYSNINDKNSIQEFTVQLYGNWLNELIHNNNADDAATVYQLALKEFPNNPEIHINGVKLAIINDNWKLAELLLNSVQYPAHMSDKIKLLENDISELKGAEGTILIRFKPGSKLIPVQAVLNNKFTQNFLLDTGATLVTIPRSTLNSLGIRTNRNIPKRRVSTAGGFKIAKEVILKTISIGNWPVHNIKALVLDLPGKSNLGLLGLNYLTNFHIELNNKKGILKLTPR